MRAEAYRFSKRRERGGLVRPPDLKSGGHGFKSRSGHQLAEFFSVAPSSTPRLRFIVNSQFASLLPVRSFNHVMLI